MTGQHKQSYREKKHFKESVEGRPVIQKSLSVKRHFKLANSLVSRIKSENFNFAFGVGIDGVTYYLTLQVLVVKLEQEISESFGC